MSGICNSCGLPFTLFRKEHSCKNCGFVFCGDCLPNKFSLPKYNNEKHKVCLRCYNILTGKTKPKSSTSISPPDAFIKRCAALDNKSQKPSLDNRNNESYKKGLDLSKYKGLGKKDMELAKRLEKLKQERRMEEGPAPSQKEVEDRLQKFKEDKPSLPSEQELRERLAKLKGQDPTLANKPTVFKSDTRSESQQVLDLLDEIRDEVSIDNNYQYMNTNDDINPKEYSILADDAGNKDLDDLILKIAINCDRDAEQAVQSLKSDSQLYTYLSQFNSKKTSQLNDRSLKEENKDVCLESSYEEHENDREKLTKLIQQILEEQTLEENCKGILPQRDESKDLKINSTTDDLPWCCICNRDAQLKCRGCDNDLYCKRCYREGHDREDYEDHQAIAFKQK